MKAENKNIPEYRFKGFTDAWEQRKLGEIADFSKGNGYSKSELKDFGKPIILYGRLYTKYEFCIQDVDTFAEDKEGAVYSQGNEVVIPASGETSTDIARASAVLKSGIILGSDLNIIRPYDNARPEFLALILSNGDSQKELAKRAKGKSVVHIHNSDIQEISIKHPTYEEQDNIIRYFSNLDHLITLQQRKLDLLKNQKKTLLTKLFPKNNKVIPEYRFKGFTDAWEQRKFEKIFDSLQNNTLSRAELNSERGDIMNIHYGDVLVKFGDYIDVSKIKLPYISNYSIVEKLKNSFLQDGDIIIVDTAEDNTVGKCTEIQGSKSMKILSGLHTIACRPKEKYGSKFLGYYINSPAYHNKLKPLMQGIKVTSISKSAIKETNMIIPKSIDEQNNIGEYFSNLDHLITLQQRKVDLLKTIKKTMLKRLFV